MTRVKIPGMVDPHTHLRDLEWSHKATFASETAAALAGGYWAVFDMPNTPPSTVTQVALDRKLSEIGAKALCDWGVYFGASQSDNTGEYPLVADDTCGLKIYNNSTTGNLLLEHQAQREKHFAVWPASRVIAVHAEEDTVSEILELVCRYRNPTHFVHISTANEIKYLKAAKAQGLPVTVGVCPHHLYLTQQDERTLGALGRMKPGLKTTADRDVLWEAIAEGVVDVIESDHAPHTLEEKASDVPPYGVPGLETTLPLMVLAVSEGRLTLGRLVELVATNPQQIWGLECPPDTYALIDLEAEYVIERENLHTQCGWSPFEGMRVRGKVIETWIRGKKVYDGEQVLVPPGFGQNFFPKNV